MTFVHRRVAIKGNDLQRWTVSFADFMTLMFAVFVVLYAMSVADKGHYQSLLEEMQNSSKLLNQSLLSDENEGILTHQSNAMIEDAGPALLSEHGASSPEQQANDELSQDDGVSELKRGEDLHSIRLALQHLFASELGEASVAVDSNGDWLTIEMGGDIFFAGASHTLLHSGVATVDKLAQVLGEVNNLIRIRGYSDNSDFSNEIYRSNWELSGMRGFSVLHALSAKGVAGERMVVEAYGGFRPVKNDNGEVNHLKSRRVVVAISKYGVIHASPEQDKQQAVNVQATAPTSIKADSAKMQARDLPGNRLIITTRQE